MPSVRLQRRSSQPQHAALAPGYDFVYCPSLPMELRRYVTPSVVGGVAPTRSYASVVGALASAGSGYPGRGSVVAAAFSGAVTNNGHLSFGASTAYANFLTNNTTGGTLHILFRPHAFASFPLVSKDDANVANGWCINFLSSGFCDINFVQQFSDGGRQTLTNQFNVGEWHLLTVTTNGGATVSAMDIHLYRNGSNTDGALTNGNGNSGSDSAEALRVGGAVYGFGDTNDADADIALVAICRRVQSPQEIARVAANPWGIFVGRRPLIAVVGSTGIPVLSAPASTSITATTATPQVVVTF